MRRWTELTGDLTRALSAAIAGLGGNIHDGHGVLHALANAVRGLEAHCYHVQSTRFNKIRAESEGVLWSVVVHGGWEQGEQCVSFGVPVIYMVMMHALKNALQCSAGPGCMGTPINRLVQKGKDRRTILVHNGMFVSVRYLPYIWPSQAPQHAGCRRSRS